MKNQISPVQKIVMVVLTIILITALFMQYGLIPAMDSKSEAIKINDRAKKSQREMDSIVTKIEKVNNEAIEAKAKIEEYKSDLMAYTATENIEEDFTQALLDKKLNPLEIKITPEATADDNPFKKFSVNINASGTLQGLISMCGYINTEKSYYLTDLKIVEEQLGYKATMTVSAVYVKEGETLQDEE